MSNFWSMKIKLWYSSFYLYCAQAIIFNSLLLNAGGIVVIIMYNLSDNLFVHYIIIQYSMCKQAYIDLYIAWIFVWTVCFWLLSKRLYIEIIIINLINVNILYTTDIISCVILEKIDIKRYVQAACRPFHAHCIMYKQEK